MRNKTPKFSLQQMLSAFYSTPNENLHLSDFEDTMEALVTSLKSKPELLNAELLRFMYKYISFKGDFLLLDFLNLIGG